MSFQRKIPVYNPGICRCCGVTTKCRVLNAKYKIKGKNEVYSDMIRNCFGLELSYLDSKQSERLICTQCVINLRQALNFKVQVLRSEQVFLQSRMYNSQSECSIHFKSNTEMRKAQNTMFKDKMSSECGYSDEDVDEVMPDGLDDELDDKLLEEYYSLGSLHSDAVDEYIALKNVCLWESDKEEGVTDLDLKMDSNVMVTYSSSDDDLPPKNIEPRVDVSISHSGNQAREKKDTNSNEEHINRPFKQAANVTNIVKYSYVCPFKSRFNHILCYYCGQYFLDPVQLREHTMAHNQKVEFKAARYKYTKLDLTRIDCRLCTVKIDNLEDFKRHLVTEHGKQYFLESKDSILPFKLVENVNCCALCGEQFSYFHALYKHMNQHFSNYMCETCGMGFTDENSLLKHAPAHDGKRYPCEICGNTFKSEYARLGHVRRIHQKEEAGLFCVKCDARLRLYERAKHMVEVHGESPNVTCSACHQEFKSRRLLTLHVRRAHMKDYRYQCNVCHKRFFLRSSLTFHMPTHTGERNFKCKVCEKSYPRLKTLKEHMKIHNNDRRYKCNICGQAFVQNCSLKGHMKSKHPDCGQSF